MVAPLIAPLVGAVARVGGTRLLAGAATRAGASEGASSMIGRFGGNALAASAQRPPRQDHGITQWARENPGEATVSGGVGAVRALTSPGLADSAAAAFNSVVQPMQFGPR